MLSNSSISGKSPPIKRKNIQASSESDKSLSLNKKRKNKEESKSQGQSQSQSQGQSKGKSKKSNKGKKSYKTQASSESKSENQSQFSKQEKSKRKAADQAQIPAAKIPNTVSGRKQTTLYTLYSECCVEFFGDPSNYKDSATLRGKYKTFKGEFLNFLTNKMLKNKDIRDTYQELIPTITERLEMHESFYTSDLVDDKVRLFLVASLIWIFTCFILFVKKPGTNLGLENIKLILGNLYVDKHNRMCYCGEFFSVSKIQAKSQSKLTRNAFEAYGFLLKNEREDHHANLRQIMYAMKGNEGLPMSTTAGQGNASTYIMWLMAGYMVTAMFDHTDKLDNGLTLNNFTRYFEKLGLDKMVAIEYFLLFKTCYVTAIFPDQSMRLCVNGCVSNDDGEPTGVGVVVDSTTNVAYEISFDKIPDAMTSINTALASVDFLFEESWNSFLKPQTQPKIYQFMWGKFHKTQLDDVLSTGLKKATPDKRTTPRDITTSLVHLSQLKIKSEKLLIDAGLPSTTAAKFLFAYDDLINKSELTQYQVASIDMNNLIEQIEGVQSGVQYIAFIKSVCIYCLYLMFEKKMRNTLRSQNGPFPGKNIAKLMVLNDNSTPKTNHNKLVLQNTAGAHQDPIGVKVGIGNFLMGLIFGVYLIAAIQVGLLLKKIIYEKARKKPPEIRLMKGGRTSLNYQSGGAEFPGNVEALLQMHSATGILIFSNNNMRINTMTGLTVGHVSIESYKKNSQDESLEMYPRQYLTNLVQLSNKLNINVPVVVRAHSQTMIGDYMSKLKVEEIYKYALYQASSVLILYFIKTTINNPLSFASIMTTLNTGNIPVSTDQIRDLLGIIESLKMLTRVPNDKLPATTQVCKMKGSCSNVSLEAFRSFIQKFDGQLTLQEYDPLENDVLNLAYDFEEAITPTYAVNVKEGGKLRTIFVKLSKPEDIKIDEPLKQAFKSDAIVLRDHVDKYVMEKASDPSNQLDLHVYPTVDKMVTVISSYVETLNSQIMDVKRKLNEQATVSVSNSDKMFRRLTTTTPRSRDKVQFYYLNYEDNSAILDSVLKSIFDKLEIVDLSVDMTFDELKKLCDTKNIRLYIDGQRSNHQDEPEDTPFCKELLDIYKDMLKKKTGPHPQPQSVLRFKQCCFLEFLAHVSVHKPKGNANMRLNSLELEDLMIFLGNFLNENDIFEIKKLILSTRYIFPYLKDSPDSLLTASPGLTEQDTQIATDITTNRDFLSYKQLFTTFSSVLAATRFKNLRKKSAKESKKKSLTTSGSVLPPDKMQASAARKEGGSYKLRKQNKRKKTIKRKCKMNNKYKFKKTIKRSKNLRKK